MHARQRKPGAKFSALNPAAASAEDGFAATDALVALAILAMTIAMSLSAVTAGRRAVTAAADTRAADTLMRALLDDAPRRPGLYRGQTPRFDWKLRVAILPSEAALRMCRSSAEVQAKRSRRRFALTSDAVCPPPPVQEPAA